MERLVGGLSQNIIVTEARVEEFCENYCGDKFHALLCDPPYNLSFMGKDWDKGGIAFKPETWAALAKHLLPGAFGMTFASSRGWHRVACAIEDAGLRLHPTIFCWAYGSGFPKASRVNLTEENDAFGFFDGHRYGLQALKPAVEPIIVFQKPYEGKPVDSIVKHGAGTLNIDAGRISTVDSYTINTFDDGAKPFGGGAGHPYTGRPAGGTREGEASAERRYGDRGATDVAAKPGPRGGDARGRWPANFALQHHPDCRRVGVKKVKAPKHRNPSDGDSQFPHSTKTARPDRGGYDLTDADGLETVEEWRCVESCPVRKLGEQSGKSKSVKGQPRGSTKPGDGYGMTKTGREHSDSGGASRFFQNSDWNAEVEEGILSADPVRYQAKAARKEREAGLDELPQVKPAEVYGDGMSGPTRLDPNLHTPEGVAKRKSHRVHNPHPTIKPIKLCCWLARLLLPPESYAPRRILIPFAGAGSEMIAAGLEGWESVVGIEMIPEYVEIAKARLAYWLSQERQGALWPQ